MAHALKRDQTTASVPDAAADKVRAYLNRELARFGAHDIVITPGSDHDGDAVVFVQIKHRLSDAPIDLKSIMDADRQARDLAWENGEHRFVHLEHIYDPKQKVVIAG